MVGFFLRLAFFARTLARLWSRNPDFRPLAISDLLKDATSKLLVIMKDGKLYKNLL